METLISISKLINESASHIFNSPNCSIWYVIVISFTKLLSHSHSNRSISLYTDNKKVLKNDANEDKATLSKNLLKEGCKRFQENSFGRIGEISYTRLELSDLFAKFFDKMMKEHSNKLVLPVHAHHWSD